MMKLIIFDFDGTLADTREYVMEVVRELQPKYHYVMPPPQAVHGKHIFSILREDLKLPLWRIPFFVNDVRKRIYVMCRNARLYPGIARALKRVSADCQIGIVSSNDAQVVHAVLKRHHVQCVSFVRGRAPLFGKHRILKLIMRSKRLSPDEVVYVGDEIRDVIAAKKARVRSAAVLWGYNSPASLKKEHPDLVCKLPTDFVSLLTL